MDPVADMLIRIKNAQASKKESALVPYSGVKFEIAKTLERAGYIGDVERKNRKGGKLVEVKLLYDESGSPKILGAKRVSKPSRRIYCGWRDIYPPRNGFGTAFYSTPKGIKTDREARKEKVGGELLFEIW